jgi:hypothetical protein
MRDQETGEYPLGRGASEFGFDQERDFEEEDWNRRHPDHEDEDEDLREEDMTREELELRSEGEYRDEMNELPLP